jgi:hypothetical protein
VPARPARRLVIAAKAAMGAADPTKGITTMTDHDVSDFESPHASSPADLVLTELQLYGYRPFQDEPDPRPLPEAKAIGGAVADIFDALISTLQDTRLEPDLTDLLWTCSIAPPTGWSAISTTTKRRRSAARRSRMARKSARSS